jgi:spore coat polysaccharide biosynthesis protein SpsF
MNSERIGAIVQARVGSRRLPGKVLRPLCGKPVLGHLAERLKRCRTLSLIGIATSTEPADQAIADFAMKAGVPCYRGPERDVLRRYVEAIECFGLDAVVRASGDSPLLDPRIVDEAVSLFREGGLDLVTNVQIRTFPKGQSVEVIAGEALCAVAAAAHAPEDREHVTPFFYANPGRFRIRNFVAAAPSPTLQLSVDTEDDLRRVEAVLRAVGSDDRLERLVAAALELTAA